MFIYKQIWKFWALAIIYEYELQNYYVNFHLALIDFVIFIRVLHWLKGRANNHSGTNEVILKNMGNLLPKE